MPSPVGISTQRAENKSEQWRKVLGETYMKISREEIQCMVLRMDKERYAEQQSVSIPTTEFPDSCVRD